MLGILTVKLCILIFMFTYFIVMLCILNFMYFYCYVYVFLYYVCSVLGF